MIIDIGSVWSLMYINTAYFNDVDNTYYYPGTYAVNHVLNIVGWDDNKVTAGGTGAWICQNTWGAGWGENGFVYVSYSDTQILNYNAYFPNFTSYDENSRVLLYNDLGNYYSLGYSQETAYALQKHPITEHLLIEEIATYAMAFGAQIEVEIYDSFNESTGVLSGLLGSVSSTTATHPGLYTFSLDEAFSVDVGDEIFVKVKYTTPSYNFPIPIERYAEDYADPQIESGVSWVSGDGVSGNWFQIGEDVVDYKMDLCINVYASVIQDITWDGSESSDWHLAQNWDLNTTPKSYHNVVVPNLSNQPIVGNNEAADCNKLTINSGASLTLNSGSSLINQSTIINNGSIMIEKTISNGQWHYISSPVANAQSGVFNGAYLQTWEETTGAWSEITSNTILLSPLQGFAFWEEGSASNTYTFSGTPNSGNYTANLTYTQVAGEENHGANLLGNPYVSSIDWSVLDDTYGAVYYWDGSIGPLGNYVEWNNGVGGGEANIPPMQGFFIVTDAPATFNLSNAHRTHVGAANFYKSAQRASQSLVISASDNWNADELYMVWNSQATNGFDMAHDAYKFLSQNQGQSQIYSINQDVKFAIDVRPENEEIQLGFSNNQNGVYGISLKEINNIGVVILEDTKLGIFYDLQKNDYSFSWDITDAATRFKLHFETTAIEELEHPSKIYAYGKTIVISCVLQNQNAYLQLYNISGQMVFKQALKGKEIIIPSIIKMFLL
ncbi:MAG: hypothetical protein B7C24_00670 [Bacteroidetes bacterium 4572_77]|nr:MAG: hypothetical protein B7C24_00670 [Bacteroidetes bacterium 4572_77]